ncbi:MAG: HEAT repeat domain-containing protein [Anaerolineales bacterium]|nr:HEAT repeat domain-containing protein [Anaerolineales bacterium]
MLGQIGSDRAVEHLIKIVRQPTTDYSLPSEAVEALGVAGSPMAIAEIQRLLDNEPLRENAIKALAQANSPKSAEILLDLFQTTRSIRWPRPSTNSLIPILPRCLLRKYLRKAPRNY